MMRLRAMLRATHAAPSLLVTSLTAALALSAGLRHEAALLAVAVVLGQFSIGWSNDWLDAQGDLAAGRREKPTVSGLVEPSILRNAAATALVGCVASSLALGTKPAAIHLVGVLAGWLYNLGLKRSAASPLPYAVAFMLVPGWLVVSSLPSDPAPPLWLLLAGALMGVGAHFLNAVPDIGEDRAQGIAGLPQRVGEAPSAVLGAFCMAAGSWLVLLGPAGRPHPVQVAASVVTLALLCSAVVLTVVQRPQAAFRLGMAVALITVAGFIGAGGALA